MCVGETRKEGEGVTASLGPLPWLPPSQPKVSEADLGPRDARANKDACECSCECVRVCARVCLRVCVYVWEPWRVASRGGRGPFVCPSLYLL